MSTANSKPATAMTSHEFKQRVYTCLDRLGDRDTLSQATADLNLIARTVSPSTTLTPFLTCLLSINSSHKSPVRLHSLRLISALANAHRHHLSPHLPKIISSSLLPRLRDSDTSIRSVCSDVSSSLARHVASDPLKSIIEPLLAALLVDQDFNVQIGSALCLSSAIESSESVDSADLRRILPKVLKLARTESFRAKSAVVAFIGSVVVADGGGVVNGPVLMGNVVSCAVELLSSDDWAARKASAETLEKVALAVANRNLVVEVKTLCLNALEKRRFDKVKIAREAMNKSLEAWKAVNEVYVEDLPLSQSNSSPSKDKQKLQNGICSSPVSSDHQSFGFETPESKQTFTTSRSSSSNCSTVTGSPLVSKSSGGASTGTPQLKTLSNANSRSSVSSLSDDSTEALANKLGFRGVRKSHARKPLDWKVDIRGPQAEDTSLTMNAGVEQMNLEATDLVENSSGSIGSSTNKTFINSLYEAQGRKSSTRRLGSRMVSSQDVDDGETTEEVSDNSTEFEDISLIRKQLIQIERQQANLVELLQTFMGTSQSGINSLETRVSGLEKALDGITHNLTIQGARIPNESSGNSCCIIRGADFLSPKFWRKNENGRFSASKPCCTGNMHSVPQKDNNVDLGDMQDIPESNLTRDSGRNIEANLSSRITTKNTNEISQRRACNGSLDGVSPRTCITPVAQRN